MQFSSLLLPGLSKAKRATQVPMPNDDWLTTVQVGLSLYKHQSCANTVSIRNGTVNDGAQLTLTSLYRQLR